MIAISYFGENVPVKTWVAHGIECAIYVNPSGAGFNGYCRLPDNSPDRIIAEAADAADDRSGPFGVFLEHAKLGYLALDDLEVHYGVNYGPDDEGWIGFDTNHHMDDWSDEELKRYLLPNYPEAWARLNEVWRLIGNDFMPPGRVAKKHGMPAIDWTMERLAAEVEHLAEQVKARLEAKNDLDR